MSSTRMPAAFLGHGNPMNALERNRYTDAWRRLGESVARPRTDQGGVPAAGLPAGLPTLDSNL